MESVTITALDAQYVVYVQAYGENLYSVLEYDSLFPIGIVVKRFGSQEFRPLDNSGYAAGTPRQSFTHAVGEIVSYYYGAIHGTDQDIKARQALGYPAS